MSSCSTLSDASELVLSQLKKKKQRQSSDFGVILPIGLMKDSLKKEMMFTLSLVGT